MKVALVINRKLILLKYILSTNSYIVLLGMSFIFFCETGRLVFDKFNKAQMFDSVRFAYSRFMSV